MTDASRYVFEGGYPSAETVQRSYDDADFNRAVSAYRFFYPTVSTMATWKGNLEAGMVPNKVFGILEGTPQPGVHPQLGHSLRRLGARPERRADGGGTPPGPLMCTANDLNQRWVIDMGLPGPDAGHGGKHVICGPGYSGAVPDGAYSGTATTNRVLVLLRALPRGNDMARHPGDQDRQGLPPPAASGMVRPVLGQPERADRRRFHPRALGGQPRVLEGPARGRRHRATLRRVPGLLR